jgi:glycosyltransferase involved in cell wall biosynthesis
VIYESASVIHLIETDQVAGVERHICSICKAIPEYGYNPILFCSPHSKISDCFNCRNEQIVPDFSIKNPVFTIHKLISTIRRENVRIIHTHTGISKAYGIVSGRITHRPVIYSRHFLQTRSEQQKGLTGVLTRKIHSAMESELAYIIATSHGVMDIYQEIDAKQKMHIVHIPSGIPPSALSHQDAKGFLSKEFGISASIPLIVMAGRLEYEKKPELFLRTLRLLKKDDISIFGMLVGEGSLHTALQDMANELDIADIIKFTGWRKDIGIFIAGADILVNCCPHESFGLSMAEALAAGRPIVAVRSKGAEEIIRHGINGLLTDYDDNELSCELGKLLKDPRLMEKMGNNGYKLYLENYTLNNMGENLTALYSSCLSKRY